MQVYKLLMAARAEVACLVGKWGYIVVPARITVDARKPWRASPHSMNRSIVLSSTAR